MDNIQALQVTELYVTSLYYRGSEIDNTNIRADAAIDASKCQQHYALVTAFSGDAITITQVVFVGRAAGKINGFKIGCLTKPTGAATVVLDLKKNGTTVLSSTLTLNSSTQTAIGVINTASFTAADVLTVAQTVTTGGTETTAVGMWWRIDVDEDYPTF